MNSFVQKTVALVEILLITLLSLNYLNIIVFNQMLGDCLSLSALILIIFSSTAVICTSKSGFNKFINYMILLCISAGLILTIVFDELNIIVYVSLLLTTVYALMDMIFRKAN